MDITERFEKFIANISLTESQTNDGKTKRENVCSVLNTKYYSSSSGTGNSFFVGSWGKLTQIRPPRDVDVQFKLPISVYHRFQGNTGNRQSQILQEIRSALLKSFPNTDIRGDGPIVLVPFQSYAIELLPSFELQNGKYLIPVTTGGGSYQTVDPQAEMKYVQISNEKTNGNTRDAVRMLKCWQYNCSVPMKSFWIELLVVKFLMQWQYAGKSKVYYDFLVRDFFVWLVSQECTTIVVPGTYESIAIGNQWKSKAESARDRASRATQYEADKMPYTAGDEWQKIFGTDIPVS